MATVVAMVVMTNDIKVLDRIFLHEYNKLNILYKKIVSLKKDVFQDNERIYFVYNPNSSTSTDTVQELLDFVDIPRFFVVFEEDQQLPLFELDFVPKESHCIYPWINSVIFNQGKLEPCCMYKGTDNANIKNVSLESYYMSKPMVNLREQFRQGKYDKGCSQCWKNESAGVISMRQQAKFKLKDIYYQVDYGQDDIQNLQMLDLKLGNTCNLSCRICDSSASSKIAEEELLHNNISDQKFIQLKESSRWSESEIFQNQILSIADNLTYLDIYGGEPLMSKAHFTFLKSLIDLGVASKIKIDYNSNGTVYSDKFFEYWKNFKEVKISFSIDNIGERFELERNGASWDTVCKNIGKFNSMRSESFKTDVFPTVSILNVYYLPELLDWINSQNFSQPPSFNMLSNPMQLAINNLPTPTKNAVTKKLSNYDVLIPIVNYMNQDGYNLIDITKKRIGLIDSRRQQNFSVTHSEFANIIDY